MASCIRRFVALVLLGFGLAGPAGAATLPYSDLHAFGDSLTDNGNAYDLSFGLAPRSPPYYRGRFSDGPIWYDMVADVFRDAGSKTRNYAVGGARAAPDRAFVSDLDLQRRIFERRADPGPAALATVFAGGNDLLARIGKGGVKRTARAAAEEVVATARTLGREGIDTALIFNLPNLADIPRYVDSDRSKRRSATRGARKFNTILARGIDDMRADGFDVIAFDTFGLFADVVSNPGDYGIDNLTVPCIDDDRNRCSDAEAARSAFADNIHPSAALHAILGQSVLDALMPAGFSSLLTATAVDDPRPYQASATGGRVAVAAVPLPAPLVLLCVAVGGLGLMARRGRASARRAAGALRRLAREPWIVAVRLRG